MLSDFLFQGFASAARRNQTRILNNPQLTSLYCLAGKSVSYLSPIQIFFIFQEHQEYN